MNTRPPPYQGGALPLSYGSERRRSSNGLAAKRGGNCHKRCDRCKAKWLARLNCRRIIEAMPGTADNDAKSGKSRRESRLAAALRENLRRRKAQARGRDPSAKAEAKGPAGKAGATND